MTDYVLNAVGSVVAAGGFLWGVHVLTVAAIDCHRRGMARVHRGTSWTPRTPR